MAIWCELATATRKGGGRSEEKKKRGAMWRGQYVVVFCVLCVCAERAKKAITKAYLSKLEEQQKMAEESSESVLELQYTDKQRSQIAAETMQEMLCW